MERYGEIWLLQEFYSINDINLLQGKYIRVTGFIELYNPMNMTCQINHKGYSLIIDFSLCGSTTNISIGGLAQFIGELRDKENIAMIGRTNPAVAKNNLRIYLKARVYRNVTGLDLDLYEQSLLKRRKFLQVDLW